MGVRFQISCPTRSWATVIVAVLAFCIEDIALVIEDAALVLVIEDVALVRMVFCINVQEARGKLLARMRLLS